MTQERFTRPYRASRRDAVLPGDPSTEADAASDGSGSGQAEDVPLGRPTLPSLDLNGLSEPVFPPATWTDSAGPAIADHPLLRGLLLELPAKGAAPGPAWLDRWFEAARAILELLYVQDTNRMR